MSKREREENSLSRKETKQLFFEFYDGDKTICLLPVEPLFCSVNEETKRKKKLPICSQTNFLSFFSLKEKVSVELLSDGKTGKFVQTKLKRK